MNSNYHTTYWCPNWRDPFLLLLFYCRSDRPVLIQHVSRRDLYGVEGIQAIYPFSEKLPNKARLAAKKEAIFGG